MCSRHVIYSAIAQTLYYAYTFNFGRKIMNIYESNYILDICHFSVIKVRTTGPL